MRPRNRKAREKGLCDAEKKESIPEMMETQGQGGLARCDSRGGQESDTTQ